MASFALSPSYTPSLLDPPSLPEDGIRALMLFLEITENSSKTSKKTL